MRDWFNDFKKPGILIALATLIVTIFGAIKLSPKKVQEINADNNCTVDNVEITSNSNNSSELKVNCDNSYTPFLKL